jgi:hypothetical protein
VPRRTGKQRRQKSLFRCAENDVGLAGYDGVVGPNSGKSRLRIQSGHDRPPAKESAYRQTSYVCLSILASTQKGSPLSIVLAPSSGREPLPGCAAARIEPLDGSNGQTPAAQEWFARIAEIFAKKEELKRRLRGLSRRKPEAFSVFLCDRLRKSAFQTLGFIGPDTD